MFQKFLMESMLKSQLNGVPEAEQTKILGILEKNPDFFMEVAREAQEKAKFGMSQQEAVMAVLSTKQEELKKIIGEY